MKKYAVIKTLDSHLEKYIIIDDSVESRTKLVNELKLEYKQVYNYEFFIISESDFIQSNVDVFSFYYRDNVNNGIGVVTLKIITKDKLISDIESQLNYVKEKINDNFNRDNLDKPVGIIYPKFYGSLE